MAEIEKEAYTVSSTSVKNTYHEVLGKTTVVNELQKNERSPDVISNGQAFVSLKKTYN